MMRRQLLYGSYTDKSRESAQTGAGLMRDRVRTVLILGLLAALIAMGVYGGQAIRYRMESRSLLIATMQTESNEAVSLANSLSRTAGGNSAATLGRIRANVHAMENANRMRANLDGRPFLPEETFSDIYTILENYSTRLLTGMNTGDLQGELQTALEALQVLALGL